MSEMPRLTPEEEKALDIYLEKIFMDKSIDKLNGREALKMWWTSRSDRLQETIYKIDYDQARAIERLRRKPNLLEAVSY